MHIAMCDAKIINSMQIFYIHEQIAIFVSSLNFNTMKQSILLTFIILFLGSCVSKSKYEDLEMENYNLREEVDRLKNKNTDLNSTILNMSLQIEELQERIENDIEYASQVRNAIESAESSLSLIHI